MTVSGEIEQYLGRISEGRKQRIFSMHELIITAYPHATVDMSYKMPTYRQGQGWVPLANQKDYISLYTCSYQHIQDFNNRYPTIKTGKGCINFRDRDELPMSDIEQVVRHAMEQQKNEL